MVELTPEYLEGINRKINFCDRTVKLTYDEYYGVFAGSGEYVIREEVKDNYWEAVSQFNEAKKEILYASCSGKRAGRKRLSALIDACESIEYYYLDMKKSLEQLEDSKRKREILDARQHLECVLNDNSMALDFFKGVKTCQK